MFNYEIKKKNVGQSKIHISHILETLISLHSYKKKFFILNVINHYNF